MGGTDGAYAATAKATRKSPRQKSLGLAETKGGAHQDMVVEE